MMIMNQSDLQCQTQFTDSHQDLQQTCIQPTLCMKMTKALKTTWPIASQDSQLILAAQTIQWANTWQTEQGWCQLSKATKWWTICHRVARAIKDRTTMALKTNSHFQTLPMDNKEAWQLTGTREDSQTSSKVWIRISITWTIILVVHRCKEETPWTSQSRQWTVCSKRERLTAATYSQLQMAHQGLTQRQTLRFSHLIKVHSLSLH